MTSYFDFPKSIPIKNLELNASFAPQMSTRLEIVAKVLNNADRKASIPKLLLKEYVPSLARIFLNENPKQTPQVYL